MPCYSPLDAYLNRDGEVVWSRKNAVSYLPLPCGKCIGCKKRQSEDWALRCYHEAMYHDHNSFITLTYDEENVPFSLNKKHVQDFIKRLRKNHKIRYFAAGEYGELTGRPHYHIIIFGYSFPDREVLNYKKDNILYRSAELESLWPFGHSSVAQVSMATLRYCVKYIFKTNLHPNQIPPFRLMSRRPIIGHKYLEQFKDEIYRHDNAVVNANKFAVPRAYTKFYSDEEREELKFRRRDRNIKRDRTRERLRVKEKVKILSIKSLSDHMEE